MDLARWKELEMEGLAPPHYCLIEMRAALQNGESIRVGLSRFTQNSHSDFARSVRQFSFDWDHGFDWRVNATKIKSPYRISLLELAAASLSGQSIQSQLEELRVELELACTAEIKTRVDMLPLQMLFPLLLLLFPSYLLLLFGPLVSVFIKEMSR